MIILTVMPASCATLTASIASSRGGSRIAISPTMASDGLRARSAAGVRPVGSSPASSSPLALHLVGCGLVCGQREHARRPLEESFSRPTPWQYPPPPHTHKSTHLHSASTRRPFEESSYLLSQ